MEYTKTPQFDVSDPSYMFSTGKNIRGASFAEYFTLAQEGFDSRLSKDVGGKVLGFGTQYDVRSGTPVAVSREFSGKTISVDTGYALAYPMMEHKLEKAREIVPKFDELKPYQQAALTDLVYNLKSSRTNTASAFKAEYPRLCRALENGDFEAASKQLGSGSQSRSEFRTRLFRGEDPEKIAEDLSKKVLSDNRNIDMTAEQKQQFVADMNASALRFKSENLAYYDRSADNKDKNNSQPSPPQIATNPAAPSPKTSLDTAEINKFVESYNAVKKSVEGGNIIDYGDRGAAPKALQIVMNTLDKAKDPDAELISEDGVFKSKSKAELKELQTELGLTGRANDGRFGEGTLAALEGNLPPELKAAIKQAAPAAQQLTDATSVTASRRMVFAGDSILNGAAKFGDYDGKTLNISEGGANTSEILANFNANKHQLKAGDIVVINGGVNNAGKDSASVDGVIKDKKEMLDYCREIGATAVLVHTPSSGGTYKKSPEMLENIRCAEVNLATEYGVKIVEFDGVSLDQDRLHPTTTGYKQLVERVDKAVEVPAQSPTQVASSAATTTDKTR